MSGEIKYAQGIFGLSTETEIDWSRDKIVSFSQFSKYRKCPKSWELAYVRKHKVPSESIYFVYGTSMHNTIQTWLHVCYTKTAKAANEMDLNAMLLDNMKTEYVNRVEAHGSHFSTKEELGTFFSDGCQILNYLKKKRSAYFSTKGTKLMAIELPLQAIPDPDRPTIRLQSHLDLVFYDTRDKKYTIIDIKTARRGWNKYKRKDKKTTDQLVLYKKLFCEKFGIDPSDVKIEYFIVRQEIDPDSLWPISRVSQFAPAAGSVSVKRVGKLFQEFIDAGFDATGQYIDKAHPALGGKNYYNCKFCEYKDRQDLCPSENRINSN